MDPSKSLAPQRGKLKKCIRFVGFLLGVGLLHTQAQALVVSDNFVVTTGDANHPLNGATIEYTVMIADTATWKPWVGDANFVSSNTLFTISDSDGYDGVYSTMTPEMTVLNEIGGFGPDEVGAFFSRILNSGSAISTWTNETTVSLLTFAVTYGRPDTGEITGDEVRAEDFLRIACTPVLRWRISHVDFTELDQNNSMASESNLAVAGLDDCVRLAISALIVDILALDLTQGTNNALTKKILSAFKILGDANPYNNEAACEKLLEFIDQVSALSEVRKPKIDAETAAALIADATAIYDELACPLATETGM